ncbi:hypothetical protein CspeluHIS016_0105700 [Cutaneotrichosporon spelunceum]|uniref:Uncharacterized protein n=1 Tax=Cutaneotrichosporon spelunceum TaxID=1672016 RepID=A0AAD3TNZ9_9TREE|nr:hypothetical protein CspeluHIS016_0105700 [Cutaneotrichosporon spelunceum]
MSAENKDAAAVDEAEAKVADPEETVNAQADATENGAAPSDGNESDVEAEDDGFDDDFDDDGFEEDEDDDESEEEYEDDEDPNAEGRRMLAELVEDGDVETDEEDEAFDGNVVVGKKRKVGETDGDLAGDGNRPPTKRLETEDDAEE